MSIFKQDICAKHVVLVTGGGSGIGFAISRFLCNHGSSVVLMGRTIDKLKTAVAILGSNAAAYYCGDVRNKSDAEDAVAYTVQTFGTLSCLINAAAGNFLAPAETLSLNAFKTVMEIDTIGTFNMCRSAYNVLKNSAIRAKIINISATLHYGATFYQTHAAAAKAAIDSLTRSLALEWGSDISVTGIAPGPIAGTPGMKKLTLNAPEELVSDIVKDVIPVGRLGTLNDIASMALYIVSSAGDYINGHTIVVDGGAWLYRPPIAPREMVDELSRQFENQKRSKL